MSIMGGLELMTLLSDKHSTSNMVLITANIQKGVSFKVQPLGANCVDKPITEENVCKMLGIF